MQLTRRKKIAAAAAASGVAAMAVLGGTLATFTDSDTTADQVLTAGTVAVELTEGADWNQSLGNLAIDDTVKRDVTVTNTSTLDVKSIVLTADITDTAGEFAGNLSDAIEVSILQDVDGAGPAAPVALDTASNVLLSDLVDGYEFAFPAEGLAAGTSPVLTFDYEVVGSPAGTTQGAREDVAANPDNAFQGSSVEVNYTIDAVQRDGVAQ